MQWHPDTCACILNTDDYVTFVPVKKCAIHAPVSDDQVGAIVHEENARRNFVRVELQQAVARLFVSAKLAQAINRGRLKAGIDDVDFVTHVDSLTDDQVNVAVVAAGLTVAREHDPMPGVVVQAEFDAERRVILTVPALKPQEVAAVKARLQQRFPGKADLA